MQYFSKISLPVFVLVICTGFILLQNQPVLAIPLQKTDAVIPKSTDLDITSEKDIPHAIFITDRHLKAGNYDEVITISKKILGLQKDSIDAHAYLAAAHKGLQNNEQYLEEVAITRGLSADSPALFKAMASYYLSLQDIKNAEQSYTDGISKASDTSGLRMGLAALYLGQGRIEGAEQQYIEALKLKELSTQDFLNANFTLCQIGLNKREFDNVIKRAGRIIDLYPPVPQGHYFLGTAYNRNGEPDKAIHVFEKLLEINPASPISYQELALLYSDNSRDLQKAISYAKTAVEKFPKDAKSHDLLGWILLKDQKYADALIQFEKATRLEFGNPMYLYHLGLAHQEMSAKTEAAKAFELALTLIDQDRAKAFTQELKSRINQCK